MTTTHHDQPCETCENGCSCRGGIDPQCAHFGCWGVPNEAPRCHAYESRRRKTYASLGLALPAVAIAQ